MSALLTHPMAGVSHLVIEELARDAHIRGIQDALGISILPQPGDKEGSPEFVVEGDTLRFRGGAALRVLIPMDLAVTVKRSSGELCVHNLVGDINLETIQGDLRLEELAGVVRIGQLHGSLRAETVADLQMLGNCNGDLRFQDGDSLQAGIVAGNLRLYNCGTARIEHVRGDLWAEKVRGDLEIRQIDGDARLVEIAGPVTVQSLLSALRAANLTRGMVAASVSGDVDLQGPFSADQAYTVNAEGDVNLRFAAGADLRLTATARGRIRSDVQLTPASDGRPVFSGLIGRGASRISINCGGDLRISQPSSEGSGGITTAGWSDLGDRIRQQVAASLSSRLPTPERRLKTSAVQGPSLDEQLAILRMLENGTIKSEQAETLLKALGV